MMIFSFPLDKMIVVEVVHYELFVTPSVLSFLPHWFQLHPGKTLNVEYCVDPD